MPDFNMWIQGIIVSVVIATIIEMILPNGNNKKYVKMILGIYIVFSIISPIINKITNNKFELSSIINVDKYEKEFEKYELNSKTNDMEKSNKNSINNLYITNLKKDMKEKLKEKDYDVKDVEIEIKEDNTYDIEKIHIIVEKMKKEKNEIESIENNESKNNIKVININEIEIVDIDIDKNEKNKEEKINDLSYTDKTNIINYISEVYGIKKDGIVIN